MDFGPILNALEFQQNEGSWPKKTNAILTNHQSNHSSEFKSSQSSSHDKPTHNTTPRTSPPSSTCRTTVFQQHRWYSVVNMLPDQGRQTDILPMKLSSDSCAYPCAFVWFSFRFQQRHFPQQQSHQHSLFNWLQSMFHPRKFSNYRFHSRGKKNYCTCKFWTAHYKLEKSVNESQFSIHG